MKEFFQKHKVIIIGLLTAIALAISELVKGGESSTKMLIFSGMIAAASWIARNLRGQWATIIGLFGNALAAYLTQLQMGTVQWSQLVLQTIISILAVIAAPAKSIGYEHTPMIEKAKKEGEVIQPTIAEPNPPSK